MAWLEAVKAVDAQRNHEAHNVIIDIAEPLNHTESDLKIQQKVDNFLKSHESYSLQTVINTLFPAKLYQQFGHPRLYEVYLETVFPRFKKQKGWGRYFERMIRRKTEEGNEFNPLDNLIEKLRNQVHGQNRTHRNVYEIPIVDLNRDTNRNMGAPCLSHISFKLTEENQLMLTAIYRNHYYIARLLGNLIGMSFLLEFVSREAGLVANTLTVVSTHALIDIGKWRRGELNAFLKSL